MSGAAVTGCHSRGGRRKSERLHFLIMINWSYLYPVASVVRSQSHRLGDNIFLLPCSCWFLRKKHKLETETVWFQSETCALALNFYFERPLFQLASYFFKFHQHLAHFQVPNTRNTPKEVLGATPSLWGIHLVTAVNLKQSFAKKSRFFSCSDWKLKSLGLHDWGINIIAHGGILM